MAESKEKVSEPIQRKALIVAFHPRTMTPYSRQYEDMAVEQGYIYDILFWDRFQNAALDKVGNEYTLHRVCTLGGSKLKKIPAMIYFRKTLKQIIEKGKYDRIVILNTLPGILLSDILLEKFESRYILDIRDYTYEKYGFYRNRVNQLIDHSFISTISSMGFYHFLRREKTKKIFLNHNISNVSEAWNNCPDFKHKRTWNIGFVGAVRYEEENEKLVSAFANDTKFEVSYYGRFNEGCHLDRYCDEKQIKNVRFNGPFFNEEKPQIYKAVDIINSLYGEKSTDVLFLLPNRLYDCALFKKPIIVSGGTYLSEVVKKYNLGIVIEDYGNIKENVIQYIENFVPNEFITNCRRLLTDVETDSGLLRNQLKNFFERGECEMSREYEIDSIDNHPINKAGKKMLESSLLSCISAINPALGVLLSAAKSGTDVFNEQKYKDGIYKRLLALESELEKLMPLIKLMQNTNDEQENSEAYSLLITIFENALKTAYTERIKYFVKVSQYYVEDRNCYYGCQNEVVRIIAELSGGEIALLQEAYQAEAEKSTIKADPNYKTGLIADSEEKTALTAPNSEEERRRIGIALLMGKALLGITQGRRLKGTSISPEQSYTITALGKKVYETMEQESQKVESDVHEKSEPYGYELVDSQGLQNK